MDAKSKYLQYGIPVKAALHRLQLQMYELSRYGWINVQSDRFFRITHKHKYILQSGLDFILEIIYTGSLAKYRSIIEFLWKVVLSHLMPWRVLLYSTL